MTTISNAPSTPTVFRLEARKSFALNLMIRSGDRPVDLTGCVLHVTLVRPLSANPVNLLPEGVAQLIDAEAGHARVMLQAADLNLRPGNYAISIVLVTSTGYSSVILKGTVELQENYESASVDSTYDSVLYAQTVDVLLAGSTAYLSLADIVPPDVQSLTLDTSLVILDRLDEIVTALAALQLAVDQLGGLTPNPEGEPVELRKTSTSIQWRSSASSTWIDLITIDELRGPSGTDGTQTVLVSSGQEARPTGAPVVLWYGGASEPVNMASQDIWFTSGGGITPTDPDTGGGDPDPDTGGGTGGTGGTHSIFGSSAYGGRTLQVYTDAGAAITAATGFYRYGTETVGYKVVGGRLYIPTGFTGATTVSMYLFTGASPDLASPVQTKTATVTPGGWAEVTWDSPVTMTNASEPYWIGYRFGDTGIYLAAGQLSTAGVKASDGVSIYEPGAYDFTMGSRVKIGTDGTNPQNLAYGLDILVAAP